ncbi:hypothetical protein [Phormidesmis sp. 146-33]
MSYTPLPECDDRFSALTTGGDRPSIQYWEPVCHPDDDPDIVILVSGKIDRHNEVTRRLT